MKKGVLGALTLTFGIICFVTNALHPLFPDGTIISKLLMLPYIILCVPTIIMGIIAIVIGSNRKGAIVGIILSCIAFFAPVIVRIIFKI